MEMIPDAFIIGVQKAGTTSLHYWLSEHPEIYAPVGLKDVDLFAHPERSEQLNLLLEKEFSGYQGKQLILLTSVNYCYYPSALSRIAEISPNAKLIILLRNPIERAISAYRYYKKLTVEKREIEEAFNYDYQLTEDKFVFSPDNNAFTYIERGMYAQQLKNIFKYFSKEQLLVLDFDDLEINPKDTLKQAYQFLKISDNFFPELKIRNITGGVKSVTIQKMLRTNSWQKWIIKNLIDPWLPLTKRRTIKRNLREWNTNKKVKMDTYSEEERRVINKIKEIYKEDINELDKLIGTRFSEKWNL